MKKLILLTVVCITTLIIGKVYYDQKIQTLGQKAVISEKLYQKQEKEKEQAFMDSIDPKKHKQTFVNYLKYKDITQGHVTIAIVGSSVAASNGASSAATAWFNILQSDLKLADIKENLALPNEAHHGYSTKDILDNNVLNKVIQDKPDMVIFETSILNDHGQSIPINKTLDNLKTSYDLIKKELPNCKILFISPNPSYDKLTRKIYNNLHLKYSDYIQSTQQYIEGNGWSYFDLYGAMNQEIAHEGIKLTDIVVKDGTHPNDKGYAIWEKVLFNFMNTEKFDLK